MKSDSISIKSQRSIFNENGDLGRIIEMAFWDTGRFYTPQYQISTLNSQGDVKYDIEAEKLSLDIVSIITPSMNPSARPLKKPVPVKGILLLQRNFVYNFDYYHCHSNFLGMEERQRISTRNQFIHTTRPCENCQKSTI